MKRDDIKIEVRCGVCGATGAAAILDEEDEVRAAGRALWRCFLRCSCEVSPDERAVYRELAAWNDIPARMLH